MEHLKHIADGFIIIFMLNTIAGIATFQVFQDRALLSLYQWTVSDFPLFPQRTLLQANSLIPKHESMFFMSEPIHIPTAHPYLREQ